MSLLSDHYHDVFSYPDAALIEDLLQRTGGPLLDFGCATGRVLEIGARRDFESVGIDYSPEMIQVGSALLKDLNVRFIHGRCEVDIPELHGKFGLVVSAANTFLMMLEKEIRIGALVAARNYIKPGGRFFIYVRANDTSLIGERTLTVPLKTGANLKFHIQWTTGPKSRIFVLDFAKGRATERHVFETARVSQSELLSEFSESGWSVEETFGDFDRSPIGPQSTQWFFVLKKNDKFF